MRGGFSWSGQSGQATVEWSALALLVALGLVALLTLAPVDGRSFGGFLAHRIVCAVKRGCQDGDAALARAYGAGTAELVRAHAPNIVYESGERQLPVDWRRCRRSRCAVASDSRDLDAHRSSSGEQATVFTRVLRRGGRTYLQYWRGVWATMSRMAPTGPVQITTGRRGRSNKRGLRALNTGSPPVDRVSAPCEFPPPFLRAAGPRAGFLGRQSQTGQLHDDGGVQP